MESGEDFDKWDVIKQVLAQLVFLENLGYYHDDLQQHNILYDNGKVHIIDYESISKKKSFHSSPKDLLQAFIIFMNDILEGNSMIFTASGSRKLLTQLKKHISPNKYELICNIKNTEKFFARLYEILFEIDDDDRIFAGYTAKETEIISIEEILSDILKNQQTYGEIFTDIKRAIVIISDGALNKFAEQQRRIEELEKIIYAK